MSEANCSPQNMDTSIEDRNSHKPLEQMMVDGAPLVKVVHAAVFPVH